MAEQAYKKFLRFVLQYANPYLPSSVWQETIGFLFGKFNEENSKFEVQVTDVLPMDSGSSVYVKVGDYSTIYDVLMEKSANNEFIVGWIHSHPGLSIFLSGTDVSTQNLYQQIDSRAIAIVVDHTTITDSFPGLKAFRTATNSYHQLDIKIETKNSFSEIYNELKREISIISPPKLIKETVTVSLEKLTLNFEGPSRWNTTNKLVFLDLKYVNKDFGMIHLQFQPNVEGGLFYRQFKATKRYQLFDKGMIVRFGVVPDPKGSEIKVELNNIQVFGKDNKKETLDNIKFLINKN